MAKAVSGAQGLEKTQSLVADYHGKVLAVKPQALRSQYQLRSEWTDQYEKLRSAVMASLDHDYELYTESGLEDTMDQIYDSYFVVSD